MMESNSRSKRKAAVGAVATQKYHNLRVRSKRHERTNRFSSIFRNECYPALIPVLSILGVYLCICYVYIWISMYKSFTDDSTNIDIHDPRHLNKRHDIIAMRLERFLSGSKYPTETKAAGDKNYTQFSLSQIIDQDVLSNVQTSLLSQTGYPQLILSAYLELPLSIDASSGKMKRRMQTPEDLTLVKYPYERIHSQTNNAKIVGACFKNGAQWILATSHPPALDYYFGANVFRKQPMYHKRWELANGTTTGIKGVCPVDADPYLPWIADVFPSNDGYNIEIIISNKRRCNTDPNVFQLDLENLEPQVGNMQPVPVKRISLKNQTEARSGFHTGNTPRYAIAMSVDEADDDGKATKFICKFHTVDADLNQVVLGETLSTYSYNPEHLNYRKKGSKAMLTSIEKGHDEQIWNSVYQVRCPVPQLTDASGLSLVNIVASGQSVTESIPSLYLDLVPIRTPVRRSREGFGIPGVSSSFDPKVVWGDDDASIIPLVDASGRWANIPICNPPKVDEQLNVEGEASTLDNEVVLESRPASTEKKHFLVGCVWAARDFSTRGQTTMTDTSEDRLFEFLTYHTEIAKFDHVYVYDNSDTSLSNKTLETIINLFPKKLVSRIPWPHRVCNNNRPMHSNPGERSSQYAAESSCRARYGKDTTWMATLDVDEYLIPTGNWENIRDLLHHITTNEKDTQILSFFQTRALPNAELMVTYDGKSTPSCKGVKNNCLMRNKTKTYMETYNCEPTTHPKPGSWSWRAKKQIYRPAFVLNHFVHYPVATKMIIDHPDLGTPRFMERSPFERRVEEVTEGFLLHSKTTSPDMTANWKTKCPLKGDSSSNSCKVGIPSSKLLGVDNNNLMQESWPMKKENNSISVTYEATCYPHSRVMQLVPFLEAAMKRLSAIVS